MTEKKVVCPGCGNIELLKEADEKTHYCRECRKVQAEFETARELEERDRQLHEWINKHGPATESIKEIQHDSSEL